MILHDIIHDHAFNRRLIVLSLPISVQSLMLALVAAGDAFMLARVSQNAMAAVSLATQIQFVQNMILFAIVAGIGVLGAQYWGKGDREVLGRIFGISIRMSAGVCIVFFLGCRCFPEKLMLLFAHDEELIRIGVVRNLKVLTGFLCQTVQVSGQLFSSLKLIFHNGSMDILCIRSSCFCALFRLLSPVVFLSYNHHQALL